MKKIILIFIALFLVQAAFEAADTDLRSRYGIYGHFTINMHNPDFNELPDIPNCCPLFDGGSGTGLAFGLLYETPIANKLLFGLRAGYSSLNGELSKTEETMMFSFGEMVNGEFEHTIDATIDNIGLETYLSYNLVDRLFFMGGLRFGFKMTADAEQVETITKPDDAVTFLDANGNDSGLRKRNEWQGEIPNASSLHMFAFGGLTYEVPLNRRSTWILAPELLFYYGFSDMSSDVSWTVNTVNIGLALKYSPIKSTHDFPEDIADLGADVKAYGVDENGDENELVKIRIEEFSSLELHPLLTYVFFDKDSDEIPDRYFRLRPSETAKFREDYLYREKTMDIYHHMLNIIGRRMTDNPGEDITLTGCNDNDGSEKGNKTLSKNRAETVKQYLTNVWGIDPGRIRIKTRNLPKEPSNINEEDGIEENRRVEIYSDSWEIMKPVICYDTTRVMNPEKIRFYPRIHSNNGIKEWTVSAVQNNTALKEFNGSGLPDDSYDWNLQENTPLHDDQLAYSAWAADNDGENVTSGQKIIPVEVLTIKRKRAERIQDKEVQRYSLILFDFNKATMGDLNKHIVEIIKDRVEPNSKVTITGHTDRIGEEDLNMDLSQRRAESVDKELKHDNSTVVGMGEEDLLYNNELPEGRFYCRTVYVVVETTIE